LSISPVHADELQIEPGNLVRITVLGYPELSQEVLVRQDGSTDYPLLAGVPIDGMTIHQLQEVLQPILARFVERPKLFISIAEHLQLEITVEGQVNRPGRYTVEGPVNLQGVLSIAGGTTQVADLRSITISRRGYRETQDITVDLLRHLTERDGAPLPEINDGDIIFVPIISSASTVRVMGAVRSPGSYIPIKDENIVDMINMAGGPLPEGNMNRIIYITSNDGRHKTEVIKLKTLINKGLTDQIPLVHPGDIIVVVEYSQWQRTSWWVNIMRDFALVLSSIVILSRL